MLVKVIGVIKRPYAIEALDDIVLKVVDETLRHVFQRSGHQGHLRLLGAMSVLACTRELMARLIFVFFIVY